MSLPQGINFRNTEPYVSDGANEHPQVGSDGVSGNYPVTTAQGNNVGWSDLYDSRNRNSGVDRRLAGTGFSVDSDSEFWIDLPSSGNYNVGLAAGDANYANNVAWDLYDGLGTPTFLATLTTGATSAASRWKDATNTELTDATWPTSQALVSATFASTRLVLKASGANQVVAHLYVESGAAAAAGPSFLSPIRSNLQWR